MGYARDGSGLVSVGVFVKESPGSTLGQSLKFRDGGVLTQRGRHPSIWLDRGQPAGAGNGVVGRRLQGEWEFEGSEMTGLLIENAKP